MDTRNESSSASFLSRDKPVRRHCCDGLRLIHILGIARRKKATGELIQNRVKNRDFAGKRLLDPFTVAAKSTSLGIREATCACSFSLSNKIVIWSYLQAT